MKVKCVAQSDRGRVREQNEDCWGLFTEPKPLVLMLVADGMGGHSAGEVASEIAVTETGAFFYQRYKESAVMPAFQAQMTYEENLLSLAVRVANRKIYQMGRKPQYREMGTTVVGALFVPRGADGKGIDEVVFAHVGDSRCYRVRDGKIRQMTRDHSLANEYADRHPLMSKKQLASLPTNIVTRALGTKEDVAPDISRTTPKAGDTFVLCSDGLSGMITDAEIARLATASASVTTCCTFLVEAALAAGGEDNVTVGLMRFY